MTKTSLLSALAVSLLLAAAPLSAAFADPSSECGGSSQVEIGKCVSETEKAADRSLQQILGFAVAVAEETDKASSSPVSSVDALRASQEAWEAFRDRQCEFVGTTFGGGSGTSIGISSCRIEMAREREKQLLAFIP